MPRDWMVEDISESPATLLARFDCCHRPGEQSRVRPPLTYAPGPKGCAGLIRATSWAGGGCGSLSVRQSCEGCPMTADMDPCNGTARVQGEIPATAGRSAETAQLPQPRPLERTR